MSDNYDVLPLPVTLGSIRDKESQVIKPFVGVYFPVELLDKMNWTKDTRLTLTVEKEGLRIFADENREPFIFDTNELIYEIDDDF